MTEYRDNTQIESQVRIARPMIAAVCLFFGLITILTQSISASSVGLFVLTLGALVFIHHYEQEAPTTETETRDAIYCYMCGAKNQEDALYCEKCGKKFDKTEIIVVPPQKVIQKA